MYIVVSQAERPPKEGTGTMQIIRERDFTTRKFTGRYIVEDVDGRILGSAETRRKAVDLAHYLRSSRIRRGIGRI
jgi:hypothetical protein